MNENYMEFMVKKHRSPLFFVGGNVCIFFAAITFFIGILGVFISLLAFVVFAIAAYFLKTRASIEYEYLYLDKELTIDKIIGQRKRKRVIKVLMDNIVIIAPIDSYRLKEAKTRTGGRSHDFSTGNKENKKNWYEIICSDGEHYIIEPSAAFINLMYITSPRKVFVE